MHLSFTIPLTLAALIIEALIGYPQWLYRLIGHPVTWMGWLLKLLDRSLNDPLDGFLQRQISGVAAFLTLLMAAFAVTSLLEWMLEDSWAGIFVMAVLASTLIAQRSLFEHVSDVASALKEHGLAAGRTAVAKIVGRDPEQLDESGVARAAIESLAENFSDGIVAPAFWMALFGLQGGAVYKAANTADSMIGHRSSRYAAFGWGAARFDDLVNLPASRLSALLLLLAALPGGGAWAGAKAVWRDAGRHRSPNAGWPEAAMAGALGLKLAGPRVYGNRLVQDAHMGNGRREAGVPDILAALKLYRIACAIQWFLLLILALLTL